MLTLIVRRLLQSSLIILAMSVIVFCGMYLIGDPVQIMASPEATDAEREEIRMHLGLHHPLWYQYWLFIQKAVVLDFGVVNATGQPALQQILEYMPATLELALVAIVLSILIGIPLGMYAGLKPNTWLAKGIMTFSVLGFSLPSFWIATMFILLFALQLGWLPTDGRGETVLIFGFDFSIFTLDGWKYILLPALTIASGKASVIMRLARATTVEVVGSEYIKFARAKGIPNGRILRDHILKNILIPLITVIGLEFGSVIAFSVITETIFAWPGMGKFFIDSILLLERSVVVTYLMLVVVLLVFINLVVDILYTTLDPRVRKMIGR